MKASWTLTFGVALRKESVDRNRACITITTIYIAVALRKESVDRNRACITITTIYIALSLSARRAWIEMPTRCWMPKTVTRRSPQGERG